MGLTDWADYIDPDAMTTLLGDAIFNIEEEEYCEAYQHALKNPYGARTDDEGGEKPLVMIMKVPEVKMIIVVVAIVMIVKIVMVETIAMMTMIVKEVTLKTMIAKIAVMIRINPLVIERMRMRGPSLKTILMIMWTIMMKT